MLCLVRRVVVDRLVVKGGLSFRATVDRVDTGVV